MLKAFQGLGLDPESIKELEKGSNSDSESGELYVSVFSAFKHKWAVIHNKGELTKVLINEIYIIAMRIGIPEWFVLGGCGLFGFICIRKELSAIPIDDFLADNIERERRNKNSEIGE